MFFSELFVGPFRDVPALWKRHQMIRQAARLVIGVFAATAQSSNFLHKRYLEDLQRAHVVMCCVLLYPAVTVWGGGKKSGSVVEEISNDNR